MISFASVCVYTGWWCLRLRGGFSCCGGCRARALISEKAVFGVSGLGCGLFGCAVTSLCAV